MRPAPTYRAARRDGARRAMKIANDVAKAAGQKIDWRDAWRQAQAVLKARTRRPPPEGETP